MQTAICHVLVQEADFDLTAEVNALRAASPRTGAVVSFVGVVREWRELGGADTARLVLEHYPGMTERCIRDMVAEAMYRFDLLGAKVIHRVGALALGEQIVMVAVSAAHRHSAFQGGEFLMDWLKTQAPFWKKEVSAQGAQWVEASEHDDVALARWGFDVEHGVNRPLPT